MVTARNISHDELRTILTAISSETRQAFIYGVRTAAKHMEEEIAAGESDDDVSKEHDLLKHALEVANEVDVEVAELHKDPAPADKTS